MNIKTFLILISVVTAIGLNCLAGPLQFKSRRSQSSMPTAAQPAVAVSEVLTEVTGYVIDISDTKIVLDLSNVKGQARHETYVIDPRAKLEPALSLSEITYGDRVMVKYVSQAGKKVVKIINTQPPSIAAVIVQTSTQ